VYEIDTPRKFKKSIVTKIRKLVSPTQPPLHWADDDYDSGEDDVDKKGAPMETEEGESEMLELPETSDEMARIYWKWDSLDKIVFRGKETTQSEFLPTAGKLGGYAIPRHTLLSRI